MLIIAMRPDRRAWVSDWTFADLVYKSLRLVFVLVSGYPFISSKGRQQRSYHVTEKSQFLRQTEEAIVRVGIFAMPRQSLLETPLRPQTLHTIRLALRIMEMRLSRKIPDCQRYVPGGSG